MREEFIEIGSAGTLIMHGLPASRTMRHKRLLFEQPSLRYFVKGARDDIRWYNKHMFGALAVETREDEEEWP